MPVFSGRSGANSNVFRSLLILFCTFFVMALIGGVISPVIGGFFGEGTRDAYLAMSVIQAMVIFIATALITSALISARPLQSLSLTSSGGWRPYIGVVIVMLLGMPMLNQIIYYNSIISFPPAIEASFKAMEETNAAVTEVMMAGSSPGVLITGILIIGILTGLAEEILFRGSLQNILVREGSLGIWAIWITAAVFSAVHLQFYGFVPRLLLGAFFGYVLYWTGSLWPAVFAHALNNSLVVLTCWLVNSGCFAEEADQWGVVESGLPWPAIISLVLVWLFFRYGTRVFFRHTPIHTLPNGLKIRKR